MGSEAEESTRQHHMGGELPMGVPGDPQRGPSVEAVKILDDLAN